MGALSYRPEMQLPAESSTLGLDQIAEECAKLLKTEYSANLDQLFQMGGSSGGVGPKIRVFVHNRDDHSKNFSYLYDEKEARYKLAPAYGLTYSNSLNGEHATTINGNGSDPDLEDLLAVAGQAGIREA